MKTSIESALEKLLQPIIEESVERVIKRSNKLTKDKQDIDKWLDVNAAANYLKLSKNTIYSLTSQRAIPYYKKGKHLTFLKSELDNWIKTSRVNTDQELELLSEQHQAQITKTKKKNCRSNSN